MEEGFLYGIVPQRYVIDLFGFVLDVGNDRIILASIPITRRCESLRQVAVPVSAPWCDKGSEVAVLNRYGYRVVPIPRVGHRLVGARRYHGRLMEGDHRVMGLPEAYVIELLVIDRPPRAAIFLPCDEHHETVLGRLSDGHRFAVWNNTVN